MNGRASAPTQTAYLELREEQAAVQEGYRFLDEQRLVLAAALLRELTRCQDAQAGFARDYAAAAAALREAIARHGPEALACYPPAPPVAAELRLTPHRVLGLTLDEPDCRLGDAQAPPDTPFTSPEARRCAEVFRDLLPGLARLAAHTGNLERLEEAYARTARRARALEDVLLPELSEALTVIASALEEAEREEAVRARLRPSA